ncbi:hypothetical protein EP232_01080, partial [bacterium]
MILTKKTLKRNAKYLLVFLTVFTIVSCQGKTDKGKDSSGSSGKPVLRIGYMICDSLEETKSRFEPLTQHLSATTGMTITPVYLNTFDVPEAFEKGELDV